VDWQPDYLSWAIDGTVQRTLLRNATYNSTTQQYHYPQSPSRIQLSLWPAGLQSNGDGTIDWAGGLVNWDSNYMSNGYYYASVSEVDVECYSPPEGFSNNHGSSAYYYTSTAGTNDTVAIGNNDTILSSFYATGDNPNYCPGGCASASASGTSKPTSTPSADVQTVPGISGGGAAGNSGTGTDTSGNSESGSGSSNGGQSNDGSTAGGSTSFSQGLPQDGTNGGTSEGTHVVAGSAVALLGFFVAALLL
jgi:hypothetical protein